MASFAKRPLEAAIMEMAQRKVYQAPQSKDLDRTYCSLRLLGEQRRLLSWMISR